MTDNLAVHIFGSLLIFAAIFVPLRYGWEAIRTWISDREALYAQTLNQELLMDISPRSALMLAGLTVAIGALAGLAAFSSLFAAAIGAAIAAFIPGVVLNHMLQKRRERLELQILDGMTIIASSLRASLNMVQSMENLVQNTIGPIQEEFAQILREFQLGLELNQAMRNAANRIGSGNYRLLFTAIEIHRLRGGDAAQSMDRIADSIREFQRLQGKLDALTAQGRSQALMMAAMPVVFLIILYTIDPEGISLLFTAPTGRVLLLAAAALILGAFAWIRQIMTIDL